MADIHTTFRALCLADATVSALVGDRMQGDRLEQNPVLPCVVTNIIDTVPHEVLGGVADVAQSRIQVDCYAMERPQADEVAETVRVAMEKKHRGDNNGTFINEINLVSGPRHAADPPEDGSDQWRYITTLDFLVTFRL